MHGMNPWPMVRSPRLQLSQLTGLEILSIGPAYAYQPNGMAVLTSLASLRTLAINAGNRLPACLSAMTGLEQMFAHVQVDGEALEAALPRLQQLTCLMLCCRNYQRIPPNIAGLSRLQRLSFDGLPGVDLSLPQGAWLASIRWLGLPWEVLRSAVSTMACAPHLECLCSRGMPSIGPSHTEEWRAFWRFVAAHPPLRCLGMESVDETAALAPGLLDTILVLKHRRPELQLRRLLEGNKFFGEVLDCADIPSTLVPYSPF